MIATNVAEPSSVRCDHTSPTISPWLMPEAGARFAAWSAERSVPKEKALDRRGWL